MHVRSPSPFQNIHALSSEEFEKELEDEINQVKELEHANRRFKVKIDMLEREKSTVAKKYDAKIEDYTNKLSTFEEQLADWEDKAGNLEADNRKIAEEWEDKLEEEKRRARDLQFDLDKATTKMKGLEDELAELRDSCSKIDEYEQVLGKLMERNEELEEEAKNFTDELEMAQRQVELSDRRRTVKVKDLEEKIEEQRVMIEQQQETLDESVKTILKLYSLNNERGDDYSVMSEEKLTDMARAMVPRLGTNRSSLPAIPDDVGPNSDTMTLTSAYTRNTRHTTTSGINSTRGRELTEEVENLMNDQSRARRGGGGKFGSGSRLGSSSGTVGEFDNLVKTESTTATTTRARSRGRYLLDDLDGDTAKVGGTTTGATTSATSIVQRSQSRGRSVRGGDRTESIRQLTERARTPARNADRSKSPTNMSFVRRRSSSEKYDPSGPVSDSRALVLAAPSDEPDTYGGTGMSGSSQYDISPAMPTSSRHGSRHDLRSESRNRRERGDRDYDAPYSNNKADTSHSLRQQMGRSAQQPHRGGDRHHQHSRNDPDRRDHHYRDRDRERDRDRDRGEHHHNSRGDRDRRDRGGDHRGGNRDHNRGGNKDRGDRDRRGGPQDDPYYRDRGGERGYGGGGGGGGGGGQYRSKSNHRDGGGGGPGGHYRSKSEYGGNPRGGGGGGRGGGSSSRHRSNNGGGGFVDQEDSYPPSRGSNRQPIRDPSVAGDGDIDVHGGNRHRRGARPGGGRPARDP